MTRAQRIERRKHRRWILEDCRTRAHFRKLWRKAYKEGPLINYRLTREALIFSRYARAVSYWRQHRNTWKSRKVGNRCARSVMRRMRDRDKLLRRKDLRGYW